MNNQYVVIASPKGLNHDIILGYFDTLERAKECEQEFLYDKGLCNVDSSYNQIGNINIYQLKGVSND